MVHGIIISSDTYDGVHVGSSHYCDEVEGRVSSSR